MKEVYITQEAKEVEKMRRESIVSVDARIAEEPRIREDFLKCRYIKRNPDE